MYVFGLLNDSNRVGEVSEFSSYYSELLQFLLLPASSTAVWIYRGANVSIHVASQISLRMQPLSQGAIVIPSGRLPSDL